MWYKNIQLLFYPILQERAVCGVQLVAGTHCDGVIVVATCLHLSHLSPPHCSNLLQSLLHVLCAHTRQHTACAGHNSLSSISTHTHNLTIIFMQAHEVMAGPSDCYCNNPPPVQHGTVASTMQSEAFLQNPAPSCRGQVAVSGCTANFRKL